MTLSDTCLLCTLPSGNKAVYALSPQFANMQHWGANLNQIAIERGRQVAHENNGIWYEPGGWAEITNLRTIALLERCPTA